ncbi:putative phage abortive infection protein [Shewanella chilikensis]|nr:putative phage abortive infection protein [Shewanella chilikensis]
MKFYQKPWFIFGLIAAIFLIYGLALENGWWILKGKDDGQLGTFGDSWGMLTSLFSALAFGGLMITIWQQQEELGLTRKEMKDQQFENMLFKMLEVHANIVADLDLRSKRANNQQTTTGRDCFTAFLRRLTGNYNYYQKKDPSKSDQELVEVAYRYFWRKNRNNLGHYFRYVYNIFKYIDNSDREDKKTYTNIVRAQLSDHEVALLYYNCLSEFGSEKFKPMAVEYELFDNMPKDLLIRVQHEDLYPQKAFGSSQP